MPDYLPSRYKSWLHFYLEIKEIAIKLGGQLDEDSMVKIIEFADHKELELLKQYSDEVVRYYHQFPLAQVKARALDYVLSKLPSIEKMNELRSKVTPAVYNDESLRKIMDDLLDLYPKKQ